MHSAVHEGVCSGSGKMGNRNREYWAPVREAELRSRLDAALGKDYAPSWAATVVLQGLGSRCVDEALRAGVPCKEIWRAVWAELELPETQR